MFVDLYIKIKKKEVFLASFLNEDNIVLIIEFSEFAFDGQTLGTFFDVADNLGIDVERLRKVDNLLGNLWAYIDFHTVTHIEYLVHLLPVCARALVDGAKQGWNGEHVVLHHLAVIVDEVEYFGLGTACTMYHTMNLGAQLIEQAFDDGRIGAGGRENQLASVDGGTVDHIGELILAAVY